MDQTPTRIRIGRRRGFLILVGFLLGVASTLASVSLWPDKRSCDEKVGSSLADCINQNLANVDRFMKSEGFIRRHSQEHEIYMRRLGGMAPDGASKNIIRCKGLDKFIPTTYSSPEDACDRTSDKNHN